MTQRNASASEELASTAEEMAAQAESLQQLVAFFRVDGVEHAPVRVTPAKPAAPAPFRPAYTPVAKSGHGRELAGVAVPSDFTRF